MRLLIIGALGGQIGAASQIAVARGSKVSQAENIDAAMKSLRAGNGADVIMIDSGLDIAGLVSMLESERIDVPVVACGVGDDKCELLSRPLSLGSRIHPASARRRTDLSRLGGGIAKRITRLSTKIPAMTKALALAEQVAKSTASVLVVGTPVRQGINGPIYP